MTTKEQNIHKEYLPDSYVLVHYRTGLPPTRLNALIADYHKTRKIQWTTEALKAYEDIKLQVSKCTIMYFMSDTAVLSQG